MTEVWYPVVEAGGWIWYTGKYSQGHTHKIKEKTLSPNREMSIYYGGANHGGTISSYISPSTVRLICKGCNMYESSYRGTERERELELDVQGEVILVL